MNKRVCRVAKEQMLDFLQKGYTTSQISKEAGIATSYVGYLIHKYNLQHLYRFPKLPSLNLNTIDSKEWAYFIGFLIADGHINEKDDVSISVQISDIGLVKLFADLLGTRYTTTKTVNKKKRHFPHATVQRRIKTIRKFTGGRLKKERHLPILSKELEVYLMRGVFDADGCITWGRRKDRNRVWHKVCFSSSLSILVCVQKILYKIGITTSIKPKGNEDCFVLEFANKPDVLRFYDYLYADTDFMPLKRKFDKYNALRLELGEIRETAKDSAILSEVTDLSVKRAETTGELNGALNNQTSAQGSNELRYSPTGGINDKYVMRTPGPNRLHKFEIRPECMHESKHINPDDRCVHEGGGTGSEFYPSFHDGGWNSNREGDKRPRDIPTFG